MSPRDGKILERRKVTFEAHLEEIRRSVSPGNLTRLRKRAKSLAVEEITYLSDGLRVHGFLLRLKRPGRFPCVIFNRGGTGSFGMINPRTLWQEMATIASWGYVVIGSQYRGNAGGEGKEDWGGEDVRDVLNLLQCLKQTPGADKTRVGMYGWSRGGLMTYRTLTMTTRVRAAVVGGAPTDLIAHAKERPEMSKNVFRERIPGKGKDFARELRKRSVLYWPWRLPKATPLLILHGTSDWRVPVRHSVRLAEKLLALRHPFRLVLFEGGEHGIAEYRDEVRALARAWFDRFVKDRSPLPNMRPHGR